MNGELTDEGKVLTNQLRKGDKVLLRNGWRAEVADNMRGNTRMCLVEGYVTELGSVYSHDIVTWITPDGRHVPVEHTKAQMKLQQQTGAWL